MRDSSPPNSCTRTHARAHAHARTHTHARVRRCTCTHAPKCATYARYDCLLLQLSDAAQHVLRTIPSLLPMTLIHGPLVFFWPDRRISTSRLEASCARTCWLLSNPTYTSESADAEPGTGVSSVTSVVGKPVPLRPLTHLHPHHPGTDICFSPRAQHCTAKGPCGLWRRIAGRHLYSTCLSCGVAYPWVCRPSASARLARGQT